MKITSQNIDKWLFDYFEGNLSSEQVQELEVYCLIHPEADAQKTAWEKAYMKSSPQVIYADKESLLKPVFWTTERKWLVSVSFILISAVSFYLLLNLAGEKQSTRAYYPQPGIENSSSTFDRYTLIANKAQSISDIDFSQFDKKKTMTKHALNSSAAQTTSINNDPVIQDKIENKGKFVQKAVAYQKENADRSQDGKKIIVTNDHQKDIAANQALQKIDGNQETHLAQIQSNPNYESENILLTHDLKGIDISSRPFAYDVKRFFRRLFNYKIALSNLRDPNIVIPDFQVMNFNSSFAGSMLAPRVDARYRTRWLGKDQFMHKATFSYDDYMPGIHGGIGITANFRDIGQGAYRDYNINLSYSPKMRVADDVFLEPSIKLTMGAHSTNPEQAGEMSAVEWERGFVIPGQKQKYNSAQVGFYQDIGSGLVINTKWFYAAVMFDNLARHRLDVFSDGENVIRVKRKFNAVLATDYQSDNNERFVVSPFIAYQNYGQINELWAGSHLRWNGLLLGGSISTDLNFKGSIGFQVKGFKMSYSYDRTKSYVNNKKIGSHSVMFRVNMDQFSNSTRRRY